MENSLSTGKRGMAYCWTKYGIQIDGEFTINRQGAWHIVVRRVAYYSLLYEECALLGQTSALENLSQLTGLACLLFPPLDCYPWHACYWPCPPTELLLSSNQAFSLTKLSETVSYEWVTRLLTHAPLYFSPLSLHSEFSQNLIGLISNSLVTLAPDYTGTKKTTRGARFHLHKNIGPRPAKDRWNHNTQKMK